MVLTELLKIQDPAGANTFVLHNPKHKKPNGAVLLPLGGGKGLLMRVRNWHPDSEERRGSVEQMYINSARYYAARWIFNQTGQRTGKAETDYISALDNFEDLKAFCQLYNELLIEKTLTVHQSKSIYNKVTGKFGFEYKGNQSNGENVTFIVMQDGEFQYQGQTHKLNNQTTCSHWDLYTELFTLKTEIFEVKDEVKVTTDGEDRQELPTEEDLNVLAEVPTESIDVE